MRGEGTLPGAGRFPRLRCEFSRRIYGQPQYLNGAASYLLMEQPMDLIFFVAAGWGAIFALFQALNEADGGAGEIPPGA